MPSTIAVASPLPADQVLDSLAAFGKDWRESKLPASVRSQGFYECRIRVEGPTFDLRLAPQGRGPQIVWRGVVRSQGTTGGSHIEVAPKQTRSTVWSYAIGLALVLIFWALPQFRQGHVLGPVFGLALVVGAIVAGGSWRSSGQAEVCREILEHVSAIPSPDRDRTAT